MLNVKLNVEQLEGHDAPVSLIFNWDFSPFPEDSPLGQAIKESAVEIADRIVYPNGLPAVSIPFTALTPWGMVDETGVPADTMRVYVGTASSKALGEGGPVSWFASGFLERSPGMTIAFNPMSKWGPMGFSIKGVAKHETLHGFEVALTEHVGDHRAVMTAVASVGPEKPLTPPDVAAIRDVGLELKFAPSDSRVMSFNPWGCEGWAILSLETATTWYEHGNLKSWTLLPPGGPVLA